MGKMSTDNLFSMLIFLIFLGALLPSIMTSVLGINTSTWGTAEVAIWNIAPFLIIAGIVLGIKKHYM